MHMSNADCYNTHQYHRREWTMYYRGLDVETNREEWEDFEEMRAGSAARDGFTIHLHPARAY